MNKRLWILAWLCCLSAAFGLYVHTALTEAARPPAPGWSRPQLLAAQSGLSAFELHNNGGIIVIPGPQHSRVLYPESGGGLQQLTVGADGEVTAPQTLDSGFAPADRLAAYQQGGQWYVEALQDKALKTYRLEGNGLTLLGVTHPADIKTFDRYGEREAFLSDAGLFVADAGNSGFTKGAYERVRWMPSSAPALCLIAGENGRKSLQFADASGSVIKITAEWALPADVQTGVESLIPYAEGACAGALVELKDFRTGTVRLVDYRLKPVIQEKEVLSSRGDLNPVLWGFESGEVQLLLSREQHKGDDETVFNIRQISWDGVKATEKGFMTRTDAFSIPLSSWKSGGNAFVLSADVSGDTKKLMLSGNSPELAVRTAGLSRQELSELLPGTFITLLPALMIGLFPMVYILVPVLAALSGLSMLRFNWAETHSRQVIQAAIAGHILLKVIFSAQRVLFNSNIPDISTQLPWYLNTPLALGLTLAVSTAAAWKTARLRNPVQAPGDFWGPYCQFALIDLSVYILLVMPYYYAYVGLPIFLK